MHASRRAMSPPSASPISAKPPSYGIAKLADRFTTPSSGRIGAPRAYATSCARAAWRRMFQAHTGLVLDAYFSGTKVKWILDNVPDARRRAQAGELAFGTVDSWLAWNLTGGRVHATDVTNASRTLLFDIHTLGWSDSLISILEIPEPLLPTVCPTSAAIGVTEAALLGASIPIGALVGDQQAALFGQMCLQPGMAKNTYGTGCFMLMNAGDKPIASQNQLLTTVAWQRSRQSQPTLSTQGSSNNETVYALEGSIFIAGAVVQWLRDGLGVIQRAGDVEALAASVADNGGVVLVPAFAGLGAPHWDGHARGAILGLTRGASKAHLARAALESDRAANRGCARRHASRRRAAACRTARRRRCDGEQFADADSGRCARRFGRAPENHRNHRVGRSLPRWARSRILAGCAGALFKVAHGSLHVPAEASSARLVAAASHPDLLVIERAVDFIATSA